MLQKHLWKSLLRTAFLIAAIGGIWTCSPRANAVSASGFEHLSQQKDSGAKQAFADFSHRVGDYQKLRKDLESKLPPLKPTDDPQAILAREQALAKKIAEARKDAKRGDIFTDQISAAFRKVLRDAFTGPDGANLYKTIYRGEPVSLLLRINQVYPSVAPVTTVPPTVLEKLPKLPQGLEYRIVGRDLTLEDMKARLVVDYMEDAYPKPKQ
jgi:hypothetical protein